jgi:hypothetical protein
VLNLDEDSSVSFGILEVLTILTSAFITKYPRGDGQEYSLYADKPKASLVILTCGIVNLVKEKYNGCMCVQV